MSQKRRIQPFSQRDRVHYSSVPLLTPFLWRGSRWMKTEEGCMRITPFFAVANSVTAPIIVSCTDNMAETMRPRGLLHPFPGTRVTVSRSSGVAKMAMSAGGKREPGDYFRDELHYGQKP